MSTDEYGETRLREAFAELTGIRGEGRDCPAPEKLWRSGRAELEPAENEAVILHVADCSACAAAWRVSQDMAEESLRSRSVTPSRSTVRARWLPLAAAAAAMLAIVSLAVFTVYEKESRPPVYRAQEGEWLQPAIPDGGPLPGDRFNLRWAAGPEGTTYEVLVTTEDLETIVRARRLDRPEFQVPGSMLARFAEGTKLFWQVSAHLPDGRTVDSRSFVVELE